MYLFPLKSDAGLAPLTAGLHHSLEEWLVSVNLPPDPLDGCLELPQALEWPVLGGLGLDHGPDVLNRQEISCAGSHGRRNSGWKAGLNSLEDVFGPDISLVPGIDHIVL